MNGPIGCCRRNFAPPKSRFLRHCHKARSSGVAVRRRRRARNVRARSTTGMLPSSAGPARSLLPPVVPRAAPTHVALSRHRERAKTWPGSKCGARENFTDSSHCRATTFVRRAGCFFPQPSPQREAKTWHGRARGAGKRDQCSGLKGFSGRGHNTVHAGSTRDVPAACSQKIISAGGGLDVARRATCSRGARFACHPFCPWACPRSAGDGASRRAERRKAP